MPPKQRTIALMGFRSVDLLERSIQSKSSLTIQFVDNQFVDSYEPTIENTFNKVIKLRGQEYSLQLIDTAGQDEYSISPQSYYMNIDGYVLVYSVISTKSFEVVKVIHEKLLDNTGKVNLPLILVGNKKDLYMQREISTEAGKRVADSWKVEFLEASAKANQSVTEIFHQVIFAIEKSEGNIPEKSSCVLS